MVLCISPDTLVVLTISTHPSKTKRSTESLFWFQALALFSGCTGLTVYPFQRGEKYGLQPNGDFLSAWPMVTRACISEYFPTRWF
jgi:hypothetical protein